tara:strand:- start:501 stop:740 length:240 start_codon:yes stop_codon:yes gene_type:complete
MIKVILLTNSERIISEIDEVGSEIGEPDCKLIKPYDVRDLVAWMGEHTDQNEFMISSDKIITMADPKPDLLKNYLEKIN